MEPTQMHGYIIQRPADRIPDYVASSPCNCRECSATIAEDTPMPSMMLPMQYSRVRRSADFDEKRDQFKQKYTEKVNNHIESLKTFAVKTSENFEKTKQFAQEQVSKFKSSVAVHPIITKSKDFVKGFAKNFEKPLAPRYRRSVEPLLPSIKVVENDSKPTCPVIESLKNNEEFGARNAQPDVLQYMPEVGGNADDASDEQMRCPQCAGPMTDSVCTKCSSGMQSVQSQYFKYVNDRLVPVVPKPGQTQSSKRSADGPYYVFDRLGHRYVQNDGSLRLIPPQFQHDQPQLPQQYDESAPQYYAQPSIDTFAHIVDANGEVMHDINPFPDGRPMAPVTDLAVDMLDLAHQLVPREAKYPHDPKSKSKNIKNHYQIVPIQFDNRNGTLVTKMSGDDSKTDYEGSDNRDIRMQRPKSDSMANPAESASLQKIVRNNNEYKILTLNAPHATSSTEEMDKIMRFLHAGRM